MEVPPTPIPSDPMPDPPEMGSSNATRQKLVGFLRKSTSTFGLLIAAPLIALFLTAHVFQPYEVDGASMETTLQNGDRLIVLKLPKTMANITNGSYIPQRWEVIIFDKPTNLSAPDSTKHLIKRVIGLPGERVVVKDGAVTVYNKDNPEGFDPDAGKSYYKDIVSTGGKVDVTVGENEVFVLGDNRGNSSDSRVFGPINKDLIVGQATARFIPVNGMKRL